MDMKKFAAVLLGMLLLSGCTAQPEAPTTVASETVELPILGAPGKNGASVVLGDILAQYDPQERFAIYGGMIGHPVADAPGELDMDRPMEWTVQCRFPVGCLSLAKQGAAITHLLNEELFTAVAVEVTDGQALSVLEKDWRQEVQQGKRQTALPQRLLLAQVGKGYLVMATGSKEYIKTFRQKLLLAYPAAQILSDEPLTS